MTGGIDGSLHDAAKVVQCIPIVLLILRRSEPAQRCRGLGAFLLCDLACTAKAVESLHKGLATDLIHSRLDSGSVRTEVRQTAVDGTNHPVQIRIVCQSIDRAQQLVRRVLDLRQCGFCIALRLARRLVALGTGQIFSNPADFLTAGADSDQFHSVVDRPRRRRSRGALPEIDILADAVLAQLFVPKIAVRIVVRDRRAVILVRIVDYTDMTGARRLKTFRLKKEADQFAATASVEVREGVHVADSASITVEKAGALWIASGESAGLERSSIDQRKSHLDNHIKPMIGQTLLSKLNVPAVRDFEDKLRKEGRSPAMVKKILTSLGSILSDASERGLNMRNPVRDIRGSRKGRDRRQEKRQKGKLEVGVEIPTREEIKAMVAALDDHWRPLLITAVFTGMRSSELRGLRWQDVNFKRGEITVNQRADQYKEIGPTKSEAGVRTIPVPPPVTTALKAHKLKQPPGTELVFANPDGEPRSHTNIVNKGLMPAMVRGGVTVAAGKDEEGRPILKAKYTGLHALRHFYASWLINRKEDGGLALPAKMVQERMGHSSIVITMDTYGHLFPRSDDGTELAHAANILLD